MKFAILKNSKSKMLGKTADLLVESCIRHGHQLTNENNGVRFILNFTDKEKPFLFRRKSKSVFVISIIESKNVKNIKSLSYCNLIRTLSNLLICIVPDNNQSNNQKMTAHFVTPEAGFYKILFNPEDVYNRIIPIAGSNFAFDNEFHLDLPEKYHKSSPIIEKLKHYVKELDKMGVLPLPFPLKSILPENDINHVYKIFGITGASYGNLSAREAIPEISNSTFWMTARGVNKSKISDVGKDIHLVKGMKGSIVQLSVPPDYYKKSRVSVDAVEHELIYRTFPEVGAIVHVHAWMDGVICTKQNYPCGTVELAKEVVDLLKTSEDPSNAVIGLKNHGLTITGRNLDDIFKDIKGKLITEVPMFN